MAFKSFIKDYLVCTRKERIGIVVIIFILFSIIIAPKFFAKPSNGLPISTDNEWSRMMQQLDSNSMASSGEENISQYVYDRTENIYNTNTNKALFYFDPNTLDEAGWEKLGLKQKTIQTILNYRNKGGYFRKPADLGRIYGLSNNDYNRLLPYISIKDDKPPKAYTTYNQQSTAFTPIAKKEYTVKNIYINKADAEAWIALPGIGEKLSARIINFRNKLGGFYTIDQVGETYGLPDSTFQKIKKYLEVHEHDVKTININTAGKEELKAHPYITWNVANAIFEYRNQHGTFKSITDLKKLAVIDDSLFEKIQLYLSVK